MSLPVQRSVRLGDPGGGEWHHLRSLSVGSPYVRFGVDVQTAALDVGLEQVAEQLREHAPNAGDVTEDVTSNGTPAVRRWVETPGDNGVRLVRLDQVWVDGGEVWRAWAVAPATSREAASADLSRLVDAVVEANLTRPSEPADSWNDAARSWEEVQAWF